MVNLDNGKLSERQVFRIGVIENIAVGIVLLPFVAINIAGKMHVWALLTGVIFTFIYAAIMYGYSKCFPEGMIQALNDNMGLFGKLLELIYVFRYIIKAALILLFFGSIIQEYMLRSYNIWVIVIPFILICGYGASRDIEKRGRLIELLFWWMIVPLIMVAVFAISNVDWNSLPGQLFGLGYSDYDNKITDILKGGYFILIIMSSVELMMFTFSHQKENNWQNALKIIIWILIAVVFAYIFIVGILGTLWVKSNSTAALNVMEASAFPGGAVERMDYPVLAFWIIGIFTVISGYMFYAKEFAGELVRAEKGKTYMWIMLAIIVLVIMEMLVWNYKVTGNLMFKYIVMFDVAISIIVPLLVLIAKKGKASARKITVFLSFLISASMFGGCEKKFVDSEVLKDKRVNFEALNNKQLSLENRDYVITLAISENAKSNDEYKFSFETADLSEYKGDSGKSLKTNKFKCEAKSIEDAIEEYYKENEKQLDLGHMKDIVIKNQKKKIKSNLLILEMSEMPGINKSVEVRIITKKESKKHVLRELIKNVYAGEDF